MFLEVLAIIRAHSRIIHQMKESLLCAFLPSFSKNFQRRSSFHFSEPIMLMEPQKNSRNCVFLGLFPLRLDIPHTIKTYHFSISFLKKSSLIRPETLPSYNWIIRLLLKPVIVFLYQQCLIISPVKGQLNLLTCGHQAHLSSVHKLLCCFLTWI